MPHPQRWLTYKNLTDIQNFTKMWSTYSYSVSIPSFYENVAINFATLQVRNLFLFFSYDKDGGIALKTMHFLEQLLCKR